MLARLQSACAAPAAGGAAGAAAEAGGRHIVTNVGIQVGARAISIPISIVTVSLTARTLDPDGFGVWTATSAFVGIFGALTELGFTTVATQRMAAEPEREGEWLGALATAREPGGDRDADLRRCDPAAARRRIGGARRRLDHGADDPLQADRSR